MEENRQITENGTQTDAVTALEAVERESDVQEEESELMSDTFSEEDEQVDELDEKEEYERLIKTRFKSLYAEDTQKLINRRFRKYKVLEERYKIMEEQLAQKDARIAEHEQKIAEFDLLLQAELERVKKEAEERILNQIRTRQLRPSENAVVARTAQASFDVAKLTKDERARLAKRAAGGEKIKF